MHFFLASCKICTNITKYFFHPNHTTQNKKQLHSKDTFYMYTNNPLKLPRALFFTSIVWTECTFYFVLQKFLFFAHNRHNIQQQKNNMFSIFVPFLLKTNCKLTAWLSSIHPFEYRYIDDVIPFKTRKIRKLGCIEMGLSNLFARIKMYITFQYPQICHAIYR